MYDGISKQFFFLEEFRALQWDLKTNGLLAHDWINSKNLSTLSFTSQLTNSLIQNDSRPSEIKALTWYS